MIMENEAQITHYTQNVTIYKGGFRMISDEAPFDQITVLSVFRLTGLSKQ